MDDKFLEYLKELESNTAQTMMDEQIGNREDAFTSYVLSQIATKVASENYVVRHAVIKNSAGNVLGEIHGYNESSNGEVLTLFYTIYNTDSSDVTTMNDTDTQFAWARLQGFYEKAIRNAAEDMDKDDPAYEVCKLIDRNKDKYCIVRFYVISNCMITKSAPKKIRIRDKQTDANMWDLSKLYGNLTDTSDHVEINIDFENDEDYNYKIPYIQMESNDHTEYRCLLMMFPAKLLYKLYKKWNTDLLLYNVRYWLTFKKTKRKHTNYDIRETLRNDSQMFLAYNNGITAIASDVELDSHNDATNVNEDGPDSAMDMVSSGILKCIKNFQIVNGGQTTASIFRAKDAEPHSINLNSAFVQVKLIVIGKDQSVNKLASKISRCSNSQNAVKDSDFSVSETFNTTLQDIACRLKIPNDRGDVKYWYYERIRGQFEEERARKAKKGKTAVGAFEAKYPKECRFTKETMAIARMAWSGDPCEAVRGAGTTYDTFITQVITNGIVPDDDYFMDTVALLMIYNYLKGRKENKNYKNGKAPVIAYSMAYLHYITFEDLPLKDIWEKQKLSENLKECLDETAELIFSIMSEMAEQEGNTILTISKRKGILSEITKRVTGDAIYTLRKLALGQDD